ncbi:MAG: glycosyltransferase family 9 protein [PVC group bacterium]|nr:glycosyltransferase family 9 protein [PVC group bacterium]
MNSGLKFEFLNRKDFQQYKQQQIYLKIASRIKNIAVYKGGGGLGDLVVGIPLFRALKQHFPQARISYMGTIYPRFEEIFKSISDIDEYIHYERVNKGKGLKQHFAFKNQLKGKIDLLIDTQRRWETSFWLKNLGSKYMLSGSPFLSDWPMPKLEYKKMHILEQLLTLPARLGIQDFELTDNKIDIPVEYKTKTDRFLADFTGKFVGILPSCGMQFKNWMPEYFAKLADLLAAKGYKTILLGNAKEIELLREISDRMKTEALIPAEKDISFSEELLNSAALLQRCEIAIGNDSGGMHLASCLGSLSATIFGPTTPRKFSPIGSKNIILYKQMACSPCRFKCTRNVYRECLSRITPEDVFEDCMEYLRNDK